MSLTSRVIAILEGATVARIRFRFPVAGSNVTIAPQTFQRVARAIRAGAVHVAVPTDLPAGVAAQYNDVARTRADGTVVAANTLEVNTTAGRLDASYVVHESLHCAYDLLRTGIDGNSEEASAYVCAALYCRMTGLPKPRWVGPGIYAQAEKVAQGLLAHYQRGDVAVPTVGLTEWAALRLSVALHPVYPAAAPGGFSGILTGAQYTHDG
ncbi:hypothetical protein [Methylosinus sp. PW1]|uniref:hypothetical protein n=1 Tax=Methylosinus sp. PW1 TaxID=107636 RepID=UPI0005642FF7|nr:hypothetical protein [Methylosinus sp. PW1]